MNTTDWRNVAACRAYDPELWFPVGTTGPWAVQIEEAKAICRRCPVMELCLQWALDHAQESGVWGGMSEDERISWRRKTRRAKSAKAPRDPILVYASHEQAHQANTLTDGDHLVWVGGEEVRVDGRTWTPNQTAWWAATGQAPVGRVLIDCDRTGCVSHLTDQTVRDERRAAERAAKEAEREAARQVSKCGTRYGYQLHGKRGETACQPCRNANTAADRRLRETGSMKTPERSVA